MIKPLQDAAFGIVPLTHRQEEWEVFIIRHLHGGHWGFPKGHREGNESPKETAERELSEETGMEVIRYLDYPHLTEKYQFIWEGQLLDKSVQYYLAEVTTQYSLQEEEISEGKCVSLEDLLSYTTFQGQKKLYLNVIQTLSKKPI